MKKSIQSMLVVGCLSLLVVFSCKKKETVEVDNETQSAVDNAIADQEYAGIVPTVNNHAINTKGAGANAGKGVAIPCDSLTQISGDTSWVPGVAHVYTLNVGNTNCNPMPDAAIRQGTLQITMTGPLKNAGSKMIIKMINYKKGTINYSCDSITVTTISVTPVYSKFRVQLTNGVCASPNWTIKYTSDRYITHYPKGNPVGTDPITQIYGTANGVNRQGVSFTVNIPELTPLEKPKSCQYIVKGVMELTPAEFKTRVINFGNGTCDSDATFTVNGNTIGFSLK